MIDTMRYIEIGVGDFDGGGGMVRFLVWRSRAKSDHQIRSGFEDDDVNICMGISRRLRPLWT
jgi:hypothetical protein